jgi:hypothetical protein
LGAFAQALPADQLAALDSADDLIGLIASEVGAPEVIDPVLSRLMLETMREAERDPLLRERLGALMCEYRNLIIDIVRADQRRGASMAACAPEAIATLVAALGDGLLLHALLDPDLDVVAALSTVGALLHRP